MRSPPGLVVLHLDGCNLPHQPQWMCPVSSCPSHLLSLTSVLSLCVDMLLVLTVAPEHATSFILISNEKRREKCWLWQRTLRWLTWWTVTKNGRQQGRSLDCMRPQSAQYMYRACDKIRQSVLDTAHVSSKVASVSHCDALLEKMEKIMNRWVNEYLYKYVEV